MALQKTHNYQNEEISKIYARLNLVNYTKLLIFEKKFLPESLKNHKLTEQNDYTNNPMPNMYLASQKWGV